MYTILFYYENYFFKFQYEELSLFYYIQYLL